jgi:hypothetical protein
LFTDGLIAVSGEYFMRDGVIHTLMWINSIPEVNETNQLNVTVSAALKS